MSNQKQISVWLDPSDWVLLRDAGIREGIPMTAIVKEALSPKLDELRKKKNAA